MIEAELEYERNSYYKLKEELNNMCDMLSNVIDDVDDSSIVLDNTYLINEKNIFEKKYKDILKELNNINNNILDTILPGIENKIEVLTKDINELMEKKYE